MTAPAPDDSADPPAANDSSGPDDPDDPDDSPTPDDPDDPTDPFPSRAAFVRAFDALPAEERAAFLADLLSARGYAVERDGRRLVATAAGTRRRVRVGGRRGSDAATDRDSDRTADEVVVRSRRGPFAVRSALATLTSSAGPRVDNRSDASGPAVVDAGEVYRRLRYAIDREVAAALLDAHLGDVPEPRRRRLPAVPRVAAVALVVVAVCLLAAAAFGGAGGEVGGPAGPSTPAATVEGSAPTTATATATPTPTATGLPPGVTPDGVADVERLTAAHLGALGRRASMDATFAGPRFLTGFDTYRTGYNADDEVTIRVRVASPDRYRVVRRTRFPGDLLASSESTLERYADGDVEYRRIASTSASADDAAPRYDRRSLATARGGAAEIDGWTRTILSRYLTTTESRVEPLDGTRVASDAEVGAGDSRRYRIVATGTPRRLDHDASDYRAVAVVAPDGFVDALEVEYVHPATGARVRVTVDYARERVTVRRPAWYDAAVAATEGTARSSAAAVDGRRGRDGRDGRDGESRRSPGVDAPEPFFTGVPY